MYSSQRVKINEISSELQRVTSGVPQGSKLSPLLFASHMGTLKSVSYGSQMVKYADDIMIISPFKDEQDLKALVKMETKNVEL